MVSGNTLVLEEEICSHLVHLEDMSHLYSCFPDKVNLLSPLCARVGRLCKKQSNKAKCNCKTLTSSVTK